MQNEQQKSKRNTIIVASVAVYAVLMLLFIIIVNNAVISAWLKDTLSVLAPIIVGGVIAYLCNPLLTLFERRVFKKMKSHGARRALSMVMTYLVVLLTLSFILLIVIPQLASSFNSFTTSLRSYTDQAITFVNKLIYSFSSMSESHSMDNYINIGDIQRTISEIFNFSSGVFSTLAGYVVNYASSIAAGVKNVIFGLFISIYLLSSKERLAAQLKKIFSALLPEKKYNSLIGWVRFTDNTFGSYIKAQLLDALLVALECALIMSITGMPYSVLLAFIIGITNIIPVFGPFIGGIPAGFIVFISAPEKLLLFIILLVLIQQIDGNFVLPKLVGSTTGMSSLGVLCAIMIMGGYFGIGGMVLGVPFFVVIGEVIRKIVNARLEARGMSVSLDDYYAVGDEHEHEKHEGLIVRAIRKIIDLFKLLWRAVVGFFGRVFKRGTNKASVKSGKNSKNDKKSKKGKPTAVCDGACAADGVKNADEGKPDEAATAGGAENTAKTAKSDKPTEPSKPAAPAKAAKPAKNGGNGKHGSGGKSGKGGKNRRRGKKKRK